MPNSNSAGLPSRQVFNDSSHQTSTRPKKVKPWLRTAVLPTAAAVGPVGHQMPQLPAQAALAGVFRDLRATTGLRPLRHTPSV